MNVTPSNITLYFAPATCARVPMVALEEIGVPFEARLVAYMRGDHRSPAFLAVNPAGKVPALMADGMALSQNTAILTYLARTFPQANLLPYTGDLANDAAVLARLVWFSADLHPLVFRIRMPHMICPLPEATAAVRDTAAAAMAFQLAGVEKALAEKPWVLGDSWSILDAYLHWIWFRITGAGFDATPFPAIARHALRMEQRPSVQRMLARDAEADAELERLGLVLPLPVPERTSA